MQIKGANVQTFAPKPFVDFHIPPVKIRVITMSIYKVFFYDFTTLILYYSKSLTTFITNSSGILENLVVRQENLIQLNGEA